MKSTQLFTDKEVTIKELAFNNSLPHKHNFFELIFVLEGNGIHNINDNCFDFSTGDVFLLTPEDSHTFLVDSPAKFCMIDFTKSFFAKNRRGTDARGHVSALYKQLEFIFHNYHNTKGNIIANSDRFIFKALIYQLLKEKDEKKIFDEIIVRDIIFLLLHFIARNIQENALLLNEIDEKPKNWVHEIITYIQQNIYDNELLKINCLAYHFGYTPDHLNRCFKKETGNTIKAYILRYKLNLVVTRLKFSDLTISEIANELNFTDESHLNKIFKMAFGKTARQYKNENKL